MIWVWGGFVLFILVVLALDLGVINRKAHVVSVKEALIFTVAVFVMAALFDVFVYFAYENHWLGLGQHMDRVDGVVFPLQFFGTRSGFDHGFLGGSFTRSPAADNPGVIAGWIGKLGFLQVNAAVEYRFDPAETLFVAGLIDWF